MRPGTRSPGCSARARRRSRPRTPLDRLDSAEETAGNLADDELREQLLHGCARVRELIEEDETAAAGEYVTAMSRRLENSE